MKFSIVIEVEPDMSNAEAAPRIAHALIRYAQALLMLGCIPAIAPLWAPEGARCIGRAWTSDAEITATTGGVRGEAER